jgi:hypothetical protein
MAMYEDARKFCDEARLDDRHSQDAVDVSNVSFFFSS